MAYLGIIWIADFQTDHVRSQILMLRFGMYLVGKIILRIMRTRMLVIMLMTFLEISRGITSNMFSATPAAS